MLPEILTRVLMFLVSLASPVLTLSTIEQADDYPLYVMHYRGHADDSTAIAAAVGDWLAQDSDATETASAAPAWGCSLFAALADSENMLYGRNFDWQYSPAVLLYYDPPDGYASVSMVDIAFLGYRRGNVEDLLALPLLARADLLATPYLPFDGMNEHGLAIGMAAVPYTDWPQDPALPTVGTLGIIREILDHARTVDEALALFAQYNLEWTGGPPVHYLIADASGASVLVEFADGALIAMPNAQPWDVATNFLRSQFLDAPDQQCVRYRIIGKRLAEHEGVLSAADAMGILESVSQSGGSKTQWSVVYDMSGGAVHVVMGRDYDTVHVFDFELAAD